MCPSNASSAIAATVSPTAVRFAHAPRPNRHTAANPTATRSSVTLFGVHRILTCSAPSGHSLRQWQPTSQSLVLQTPAVQSFTDLSPLLVPAPRQPNPSSVAHLLPPPSCFLSSFCASNRGGTRLFSPPQTHQRDVILQR